MNRSSNGRILGIAIAASIAVHLAFASVIRVSPVTAAPEQKPRVISIFDRPPVKPKPTPTPRPHVRKRQPNAKPAHAVRPRINPVHLQNNRARAGVVRVAFTPGPLVTPGDFDNGDANIGTATAAPSAPPAPTPTPKPACSAPDIPAKAIDAVTPETPQDVPVTGVTAKVEVTLDAIGAVVGTKIYTSTGYAQLDRAAMEAARESRYTPEERDCKSIPGSYLFTVDFQD